MSTASAKRGALPYELAFRRNATPLLITRPDGGIVAANPAACTLLRYTEDELRQGGRELIMDPCDPGLARSLDQRARDGSVIAQLWARRSDGLFVRLEVSSALFHAGDEQLTAMTLRDVSLARNWEFRQSVMEAVVGNLRDGVGLLDPEWRVIWASPSVEHMLGVTLDELRGHQPPFYQELCADPARHAEVLDAIEHHGRWSGELRSRRACGEGYPVHGSIVRITGEREGECSYVVILADASELHDYASRLDHATRYDAVSGLPNRACFEAALDEATRRAARQGSDVSVLCVHVDRFSAVNQSFGHAFGDRVICDLAGRVVDSVAGRGLVARHSGAGFLVMVEGPLTDSEERPLAEQLREAIGRPIELDGRTVGLTASVGVSDLPVDPAGPASLLGAAETAAREAVRRGGDMACHYRREGCTPEGHVLAVAGELGEAVQRGEIVAHFQPIHEAGTGRVTSVEMLARWNHPSRGLLGPGEFIGVAERSGLIVTLATSLVRQACALIRRLDEAGAPEITVSVNVCARQFQDPAMVERVAALLEEEGVDSRRIVVELTETAMMRDPDAACAAIARLRALGVAVHIDDFGTGYASLAYLRQFEVDGLKIDHSFVSRLLDDDRSAAIVRAVLAVAHELDLGVIAEGVEQPEQAEWLTRMGCQGLQGFHFARPAAADDVLRYVLASPGGAASGASDTLGASAHPTRKA